SIPAELVAPTPVIAEQHTGTGIRRTYDRTVPTRERVVEYERGQRERGQGPEMKPTYVSSPPPPSTSTYPTSATRYTSTGERGTTAERKKFLRYTTDGYVEPTNERKKKKDKVDKLKWR
ncbi:MAG: hypothetical protein RQ714_09540, partial [Nitrosomonas sp.]|nr:hypothetical protein [Nitrosomonas sp.]